MVLNVALKNLITFSLFSKNSMTRMALLGFCAEAEDNAPIQAIVISDASSSRDFDTKLPP
jgi:hypothetical protein